MKLAKTFRRFNMDRFLFFSKSTLFRVTHSRHSCVCPVLSKLLLSVLFYRATAWRVYFIRPNVVGDAHKSQQRSRVGPDDARHNVVINWRRALIPQIKSCTCAILHAKSDCESVGLVHTIIMMNSRWAF